MGNSNSIPNELIIEYIDNNILNASLINKNFNNILYTLRKKEIEYQLQIIHNRYIKFDKYNNCTRISPLNGRTTSICKIYFQHNTLLFCACCLNQHNVTLKLGLQIFDLLKCIESISNV